MYLDSICDSIKRDSALEWSGRGNEIMDTKILPEDRYSLEIVESEYAVAHDGAALRCKAQVIEGERAGHAYWLTYDLENRDEAKQQTGQREFAGLRRAVGVLNPEDSGELHWKAFDVQIGVRTNDAGEPENVIRKYIFDQAA